MWRRFTPSYRAELRSKSSNRHYHFKGVNNYAGNPSGIRETDRRAAQKTAGIAGALRKQPARPFQRDQFADRAHEPDHEGDLQQADAVAAGSARPPPGTPVHARLHRPSLHEFHRALRRPPFPRRQSDCRRFREVPGQTGHGHRHPERARHEIERLPQLRLAEPRGLPQGDAPDAAGRQGRWCRSSR